jgi:hypothetical protein
MKLTIPDRLRMSLTATTAILILFAYITPASAGQPECPCWTDGAVGLMADVIAQGGAVGVCTAVPESKTPQAPGATGAVFSSVINKVEAGEVIAAWFASLSTFPEFGDGRCGLNVHAFVRERGLDKRTAWACIHDMTSVCQALGF